MNKLFVRAVSLALAALPLALQAQPITEESKAKLLEAITERISTTAYVQGADFTKLSELLAKHDADIKKATTVEAFSIAVNLAFDDYKFSHLQLLSPRAATTQSTGRSVGIGIMALPSKDGVRIARVIKDGPADKAGLKVDDVITKADGKQVSEPEQIRGEENTTVQLTVKRAEKSFDVSITRKVFSVLQQDTLTWVDPKTALITVHSFGAGYDQKLIEKLCNDASKAEKLIIDLRSNGGGSVLNLFHLAGKVMPENSSLGKFITKDDANRFTKKYPSKAAEPIEVAKEFGLPIRSMGAQVFKGKLAVLIGPGSGSASEIFAASIQDSKRGMLIGAKSAGAVLASRFYKLPEEWALQVPFMEYVTPNGKRLEGDGVKPDQVQELKVVMDDAQIIKIAQTALNGG
ncbi:MAG: S41 family peptidase [Fimbriimonadales bacterium]